MLKKYVTMFRYLLAKKKETEVEPDVVEPPPPLEIEISIQLHKWATTNESLQAEE